MAPPVHLPAVTFRPTRAQRNERFVGGISCVVVGVCIIVLSGRAGMGAIRPGARTTIDADGVRASSVFRRHLCRWSEVTEVDLDIEATDGPPMVYSVRIHRRDARPFTLPAPSDSVRKDRHANPDFTDHLATIRSYWLAGSGIES
jgi:hypothetical protein